jgi:hypothetical protein
MVTTRHVFFIDGFDPKGASSFYQKHSQELGKYSQLSGTTHTLGPRTKHIGTTSRWHGTSQQGTHPVDTTFDYLGWDDCVRSLWARTPLQLARQALRSLWDFTVTGAARRLHALAPATVYAALFPYGLVVAAFLAVMVATFIIYSIFSYFGGSQVVVVAATLVVALASSYAAWRALQRTPTTWFLRVVAFANCLAHRESAALEERVRTWSQQISAALSAHQADEVLLVGYSAGSSLAVHVAAQVLQQASAGDVQRIALLTLGNCIPVAAALPAAVQVRADLAVLGSHPLHWVDYTAPIDWGSFPLVDPVTMLKSDNALIDSTVLTARKFLSPQFHLLSSTDKYQAIKKDKYQVHQLYLKCPELKGRYDYFAILYGNQSLQQRVF